MVLVYPSHPVGQPDRPVRVEEGAEHLGQLAELLQVGLGQGVEPFLAERGERQADEAVVVGVATALEEPEILRPVDEPHGGVMPDEQVAGHVGDRRAERMAVAANGQQQLVLGRGHPELGRLLLAEPAESAQGDPELQDPGELLVRQHGTEPYSSGTAGVSSA